MAYIDTFKVETFEMSMSIFTRSFQYIPRKREFWMRFLSYSTSVIYHVNKQYLCMGLLQRRMGLRGKKRSL